jgi:hypothetical protein
LLITTAQELQDINLGLSGSYELGNDIDCSAIPNFIPLGNNVDGPFSGIFDGKNHQIKNVHMNISAATLYGGLFGIVSNTTIKNTEVTIDVESIHDFTGGLIGVVIGPTIVENCRTYGRVQGWDYTGGLIGNSAVAFLTVRNCFSDGTVSGHDYVGGLIGLGAKKANIVLCFTTNTVTGRQYTGGLFGLIATNVVNTPVFISKCYTSTYVQCLDEYAGGFSSGLHGLALSSKVSVENSYSMGIIENIVLTMTRAGGCAGYLSDFASSTNVYSTCKIISMGSFIGGLFGSKELTSTTTSCYWDTQSSGQATSASGTGEPTFLMKIQSIYIGWYFANIWIIDSNYNYGYPCLRGMPCFPFLYNGVWITTPTVLRNLAIAWGITESILWESSIPGIPGYSGGVPTVNLTAVVTNPATFIHETSGTLNGTLVSDDGSPCTVWFEYGITSSYGSTSQKLEGKTTGNTFSLSISCGTGKVIHYRAVASNAKGTVYGSDMNLSSLSFLGPVTMVGDEDLFIGDEEE